MADDDITMGPIGYLVVEFPNSDKMNGEALLELVNLTDKGLIRVLDLLFVHREDDGTATILELTDIDGDGELDLAVFDGVSSGLLGQGDADEAAAALEPGASAALMLYENHWAAPFAAALRRTGAQLVAAGFIPLDEIAAMLDETE